jgi:putative transcriptional regulator
VARERKPPTARRTTFGRELEESAKEILAHLKGEVKRPVRRIVLPDEVDVRRIRTRTGMSQGEFARAFCINPRTLQEWEQGRRKPDDHAGVSGSDRKESASRARSARVVTSGLSVMSRPLGGPALRLSSRRRVVFSNPGENNWRTVGKLCNKRQISTHCLNSLAKSG